MHLIVFVIFSVIIFQEVFTERFEFYEEVFIFTFLDLSTQRGHNFPRINTYFNVKMIIKAYYSYSYSVIFIKVHGITGYKRQHS